MDSPRRHCAQHGACRSLGEHARTPRTPPRSREAAVGRTCLLSAPPRPKHTCSAEGPTPQLNRAQLWTQPGAGTRGPGTSSWRLAAGAGAGSCWLNTGHQWPPGHPLTRFCFAAQRWSEKDGRDAYFLKHCPLPKSNQKPRGAAPFQPSDRDEGPQVLGNRPLILWEIKTDL